MKPIEAGCKAIVINSTVPENIGKTVKVLCFVPENSFIVIRLNDAFYSGGTTLPGWIIEGEVTLNINSDKENIKHSMKGSVSYGDFRGNGEFSTNSLMRIDGDEDVFEKEISKDIVLEVSGTKINATIKYNL